MTPTTKFSVDQVVFNRDTKEQGTIRRVYESSGVTKYEVAIFSKHLFGCDHSDWAESVLEVN
jgi:hypothetical protein